MLVKLGGKFHEKPSKGEEGLWRVAEMATKNAMFIGQPHTQRHLWRKRNGQKLDREVDSSKSLANSNTYLAHNRVQIFFEGSFLFKKNRYIQDLTIRGTVTYVLVTGWFEFNNGLSAVKVFSLKNIYSQKRVLKLRTSSAVIQPVRTGAGAPVNRCNIPIA